MPTFRNDSSSVSYRVEDISGEMQTVRPGESVATKEILTIAHSDFTKTADTPVYAPVLAQHVITFSGENDLQAIALDNECDKIRIHKVSSSLNVDVYLQSSGEADPVLRNFNSDDDPEDVVIEDRASQVLLNPDAAGTCQVVEFKND